MGRAEGRYRQLTSLSSQLSDPRGEMRERPDTDRAVRVKRERFQIHQNFGLSSDNRANSGDNMANRADRRVTKTAVPFPGSTPPPPVSIRGKSGKSQYSLGFPSSYSSSVKSQSILLANIQEGEGKSSGGGSSSGSNRNWILLPAASSSSRRQRRQRQPRGTLRDGISGQQQPFSRYQPGTLRGEPGDDPAGGRNNLRVYRPSALAVSPGELGVRLSGHRPLVP